MKLSVEEISSSIDDDAVYCRINIRDTNYVNRIIEGYEYLGVMTTLDASTGLTVIRTTKDTRSVVIQILKSLSLDRLEFVDFCDKRE
ncbi:DUF4911 domain-containing protein [Veillonella montpellierensis]|uniref:DUF4911 domain-containing protein n=1 Tax=Veillonella montpellierensis TaxID=187328 RepID=UPI0023F61DCF|nr:DUF4911 domain-containing protein [Veillonella montpellierensis]